MYLAIALILLVVVVAGVAIRVIFVWTVIFQRVSIWVQYFNLGRKLHLKISVYGSIRSCLAFNALGRYRVFITVTCVIVCPEVFFINLLHVRLMIGSELGFRFGVLIFISIFWGGINSRIGWTRFMFTSLFLCAMVTWLRWWTCFTAGWHKLLRLTFVAVTTTLFLFLSCSEGGLACCIFSYKTSLSSFVAFPCEVK